MVRGDSKMRSFTLVNAMKHGSCQTKGHGGRFVSRNHAAAAKKAFSELCRTKRIKGQCTLVVSMRETTRGSACKVRTYKCKRVKLSEPVVRLAGTDNEYKIEYKVECHASDVPEECRKPGQSRGRALKRTAKQN